jgi:hypothetical protein
MRVTVVWEVLQFIAYNTSFISCTMGYSHSFRIRAFLQKMQLVVRRMELLGLPTNLNRMAEDVTH